LAPHAAVLRPAPVVRPDWPGWRESLGRLVAAGAPAVRTYPQLWGMAPGDSQLAALAAACAADGCTLVLTVRFEDLRQRHPLDVAPDLSAAHVRELARSESGARIVVTAAGKEFIEEVHWGLTPAERAHVFYDFSWVWGPPTDELAQLFRTVGRERFVYGTMWPLRLTQGARANLALLPDDATDEARSRVLDAVKKHADALARLVAATTAPGWRVLANAEAPALAAAESSPLGAAIAP
ncbi:MAG: hypothetical protein ACLGIK_16850, partial [Gemmatimonadota bacterium]